MSDSHPPASKGTILVADDNPDILDVAKTILEGDGYGVQTAANGLEVFSRLEEQMPDLIILDITMPHMDGLDVLERLKGSADTSSVPVILLTAKFQQKDALRSYKLEANYYMPKPFTSTQMINVIDFVFRGDQKHLNQPDQFFKD